jgi:predicted nucleic acid-binding protein
LQTQSQYIGLDSQCYSYLLDAISGISKPTDSLASEKVALIRAWFYKTGQFSFVLTETVVNETSKIKNIERRNRHDSFRNTLFHDPAVQDPIAVKNRANEFYKHHRKLNDCLVLAEAEELRLDVVLTYDDKFWKRLQNSSGITRLMKPSNFWVSLQLPRGVRPTTVPHETNPLSQQQWWRW